MEGRRGKVMEEEEEERRRGEVEEVKGLAGCLGQWVGRLGVISDWKVNYFQVVVKVNNTLGIGVISKYYVVEPY